MPVPESLQCLCTLGLVHEDVTLANATLTELLKLGEPIGDAVEEGCLLTCTLQALKSNYRGVHRVVSAAIHRYCLCMIFREIMVGYRKIFYGSGSAERFSISPHLSN